MKFTQNSLASLVLRYLFCIQESPPFQKTKPLLPVLLLLSKNVLPAPPIQDVFRPACFIQLKAGWPRRPQWPCYLCYTRQTRHRKPVHCPNLQYYCRYCPRSSFLWGWMQRCRITLPGNHKLTPLRVTHSIRLTNHLPSTSSHSLGIWHSALGRRTLNLATQHHPN